MFIVAPHSQLIMVQLGLKDSSRSFLANYEIDFFIYICMCQNIQCDSVKKLFGNLIDPSDTYGLCCL